MLSPVLVADSLKWIEKWLLFHPQRIFLFLNFVFDVHGFRYQMPLALIGLLSCLALWDVFKFCSDRWGLDHYPVIQQCLVRIAQCGTLSNLLSLESIYLYLK